MKFLIEWGATIVFIVISIGVWMVAFASVGGFSNLKDPTGDKRGLLLLFILVMASVTALFFAVNVYVAICIACVIATTTGAGLWAFSPGRQAPPTQRKRNCSGLVFMAAMFCAATTHAAEWQPMARQCVEEIEQQAGCTSACVDATWEDIVRCTNARVRRPYPPGSVAICMQRTKEARAARRPAELLGDPVKETFECAGR